MQHLYEDFSKLQPSKKRVKVWVLSSKLFSKLWLRDSTWTANVWCKQTVHTNEKLFRKFSINSLLLPIKCSFALENNGSSYEGVMWINFLTRESVSCYKQPLRLCVRNIILRSTNAKYHYSYLFFYKMNKGHLPWMYSCVFWCEFDD